MSNLLLCVHLFTVYTGLVFEVESLADFLAVYSSEQAPTYCVCSCAYFSTWHLPPPSPPFPHCLGHRVL
jgi:hypothetical protein